MTARVERLQKNIIPVQTAKLIFSIFTAIILLYVFLIGVKCLGTSIGLMGKDFAKTMIQVTSNPFIGIFVGILTTALFQSSSLTTSLIVGLVSAGTLPMSGAIPMIMGANIGTSVTNTLVSLADMRNKENFKRSFAAATVHDFFNFLSVIILFPIEMMTGILEKTSNMLAGLLYGGTAGLHFKSPIKAMIKPPVKAIKSTILGMAEGNVAGIIMLFVSFIIIIAALTLIVRNMRPLVESSASEYINKTLGHPVLAITTGILITISVQSSSITTSLLIPMAGAGLLSLRTIFPITIGANIGTTTTALAAALAGNVHGLAIALVHLLFNIGGLLIWFPIKKMRKVPIVLAEKFAELAANKKSLAIGYIIVVFFCVPLFLILITK